MTGARLCEACGRSLDGTRAGKTTCGDKCRTAAWRKRTKLRQGDVPASPCVTVTGPPVTVTGVTASPRPNANHGECDRDTLYAEAEHARVREKFGEEFR